MRILKLRLKNLNSLSGEWAIDFTSDSYQSDALFAITGPTGSGKSTILDAICLALYGKTPRLDKINASANEIMSKRTGDCFAELEFSCAKGHFRCHWSQKKARNWPDGKLQAAKHEIVDVEENKVVEEKLSLVSGVVEDKTGMDFSRFTRSILLAQGSFDIFLKASSDERSPILEQITGTEIYSEISKKVHERKKIEEEKLQKIELSIGSIKILSADEEDELNTHFKDLIIQEKSSEIELKKQSEVVNWQRKISELNLYKNKLDEEKENLDKSELKLVDDRIKLKNGEKAALLEGDYSSLKTLKLEQDLEQKSLVIEEDKVPKVLEELSSIESSLKAKQTKLTEEKAKQSKTLVLIKEARVFDTQIKEVLEQSKNAGKNLDILKTEQKKHSNTKIELENDKKSLTNSLNKITDYLEKNKDDEKLIGSIAGIEVKCGNCIKLVANGKKENEILNSLKENLKVQNKELLSANQHLLKEEEKQANISSIIKDNKEKKEALLAGKLLREYTTEKDNLIKEINYLNKIQSLEEERDKLKKDSPCPLCGSTDHPLLIGKVPTPDLKELALENVNKIIASCTDIDEFISKNEILERKIIDEINKFKISRKGLETNGEAIAAKIVDKEKQIKDLRSEYKVLEKEVLVILKPFDISSLGDGEKLLIALKKRANNYQKYQAEQVKIEQQNTILTGKIENIINLIKDNNNRILEAKTICDTVCKKVTEIKNERDKLSLPADLNKLENQLSTNIINCEQELQKAQISKENKSLEKGKLEANIAGLILSIKTRLIKIEEKQNSFSTSLKEHKFLSEEDYLSARLESSHFNSLKKKITDFDNNKLSLESRLKENSTNLQIETDKELSDKPADINQEHLQKLQEEYNLLLEKIGSIKEKINNNIEASKQIAGQQEALDGQRKETDKWLLLHSLIGSADGKKFRNFAQGLTFDIMIDHANDQLRNMNDRYLLTRNPDISQPLDLLVVDNYQAGEERSTQNLSGGESFIISLALALGLSNMASQNVRVDSLFLDEGFGTLDEDALSTALETLASLRGDDKLIGVISHVPALKERIANQISVIPDSAGNSKISGPGCSKILV